MRNLLVIVLMLILCGSASAVLVDLTEYFPQTLSPRYWRSEDWGGGYIDDYQQEGYSSMIDVSALQNYVEYDFVLNFFPVGDDIDDISNFFYEVVVGINWGEAGIGYGNHSTFYIGSDWQIGEWNQWELTKTFTDLEYCRVQMHATFYRTAPEPWSGEWQTTLYIDSPIVPEPSMLLLAVAGLSFIRRRK